jgi:hypothetical protein|tara:strand:- start:816 stop:1346 length:531 start_codon:yes stop_codon:yes gene_type:complete
MKIKELFNTPKISLDTISSGTTSSVIKDGSAQDIVPQNKVPENELALVVDSIEEHDDHSAITEGVSQIFRRQKGGAPTKGFRCTSGPRKGRIVAKPSTCFQKTDPQRSAKIRKKRGIKARISGKKLGQTKRSGAGSRRLKGVQIKKTKGSQPRHGKSSRSGSRPLMKSKVIKPKKS